MDRGKIINLMLMIVIIAMITACIIGLVLGFLKSKLSESTKNNLTYATIGLIVGAVVIFGITYIMDPNNI